MIRVKRTVKKSTAPGKTEESTDIDQDEEIEVHRFVTQPAVVRFHYPITRSVSFQSVGLSVGVDLPCYVEEIEAGLERAKQLVVARMKAEMPKMNEVLDKLVEMRNKAEGR